MARWKARAEFLLSVIERLFLSLAVQALQGKIFVCLSVTNFAQKLPKHWDSAYLCQGTSYQCRDRGDTGTGKTCVWRRYALSQCF